MNLLDDQKRITCFLPKGKGHEILQRLHDEKGIRTGNIHSGRGMATGQSVSFGAWAEQDVLDVVISNDRADEIFEFIYLAADIDQPGGGFMLQRPLELASLYTLPDVEEDQEPNP